MQNIPYTIYKIKKEIKKSLWPQGSYDKFGKIYWDLKSQNFKLSL